MEARSDVHLRVAVPCFGGLWHATSARSVMMLTHKLTELGVPWDLDLELHESLVQRARNNLVHRFMKSDATHLLFIDADIEFKAMDVIGMLGADKPMVCGAYPKKTINRDAVIDAVKRGEPDPFAFASNYAINVLPPKNGETEVTVCADQGCVPIMDAATGFLLVRKSVFLDMAAAMPELLYYSDSFRDRGEAIHSFFDCIIEDGRFLSEDFCFSRRWQRLGGTVWLFLPAKLMHIGTYTYRGDLFKTFEPVWSSSVSPTGGATEWCDALSLPNADPQRRFHLDRYEWAARHCHLPPGTRVANAPCGANYGAQILARDGADVVGLDRNRVALAVSQAKAYGATRHVDDLVTESLDGFHAVVCLEGWEHLTDPEGWFRRLSPTVRDVALSVPIVPTVHYNKFHLRDWTQAEVLAVVESAGWVVRAVDHQDEFQKDAVLLVRATR